ncbi:hypothetical protein H8959_019226 [Pygathrix nigripes]
MWLSQALLLLILPGYSIATEITGPTTVNGSEWGSLTVQCAYGSGWETYLKWWCRGADWNGCNTLVKTNGSEQEVKKNRVSIRDNQKNRTFTVTMESLKRDDADSYWCGIQRTGIDLGVNVQVTIKPASSTENSVKTPGSPTRPSQCQGSLPSCAYFLLLPLLKVPLLLSILGAILWVNRPWRTPWTESEKFDMQCVCCFSVQRKSWAGISCVLLLRAWFHPLPWALVFRDETCSVTLESLTEKDAGGYWCRVNRLLLQELQDLISQDLVFQDLIFQVEVSVFPALGWSLILFDEPSPLRS